MVCVRLGRISTIEKQPVDFLRCNTKTGCWSKISIFPVVAPTMTTLSLIQEAIMALKERTGSSVVAINKYLETEKKVRCL
jgi:hypothetical protein